MLNYFTLGQVILFPVLYLACLIIIIYCAWDSSYNIKEEKKNIIIAFLVITFVFVIAGLVCFWYNTHTASGIRNLKDTQSEINNGITREIVITAEDGREIFRYEGKVDVESNHEDNYIKFEGEDGKRYIIYYGIQDTITIIEK